MADRRLLVLAPGPTANGDLHLGHLAGPFLAADVCARYARATGADVLFGTGVHSTQTFIVTVARRLGLRPEELASRSADQVAATLAALGIEPDGFVRFDDRYVKAVLAFFERLHASGHLRLRSLTFPYSPATGQYLLDAFVRGGCPTCLADGCAGLCESCGHPIASGELIDPRSTLDPDDPVEPRAATVLVLPVEDFRAELESYFARIGPTMRPRMARAIAELLARPLPDLPITLPLSWGIPAPFAEVPDQVVYADNESMAWCVHATTLAAERRGEVLAADDEPWTTEADPRIVLFHGIDGTYAFAPAAVAMLMALGDRYALPEQFVTNEFYELERDKFSTSRGHAVWGRELAAEVPRDLIRFYLALTSPEFQRSDFGRAAMDTVTTDRLVDPWNRVAAKVDPWVGRALPVSARSRAAAERIADRFAGSYELGRFSLTAAAFALTEQLARLDRWAVTESDAGDFCHQVDTFLRGAAPILIDLAAAALPDTTFPGDPTVAAVTARALPRLSWTPTPGTGA
ncbi:class I tRNA ligase family protein [Actinokineospora enzanensis]|uniref:class I tRNA ligase family protein n=1 Tax=Actinokineospora enzanensis TaxID=155975 RepID=UPI00037E51DA|nr:class I tRNA ligase family protein [Actinokineospora enzanensis]